MAATEMRNIALGKESRFCNMHDLTENLTDGNINSTEEITTKCGSNAFLDINLGSIYYIHYVLIYDGQGSKGQLDYFIVRLFVSGAVVLCSQYPDPSPGPGVRMKVNCEHQGPTSKVRIESHKDEGFVISEVEVYIPAIPISTNGVYYEVFQPQPRLALPQMSHKALKLKRRIRTSTSRTNSTKHASTTTTEFLDEMPCMMIDGECQCHSGYTNVDNTVCKWNPKYREQQDYDLINYLAYALLGLVTILIIAQLLWNCLPYEKTQSSSSEAP